MSLLVTGTIIWRGIPNPFWWYM